MQIAHHERSSAVPRSGEFLEFHRHAANTNDARIQNAVDAGKNRCDEENTCNCGPCVQMFVTGQCEAEQEINDPGEARCNKEKVQQAEPDGSDLINESNQPVRKAETEQRAHDKND